MCRNSPRPGRQSQADYEIIIFETKEKIDVMPRFPETAVMCVQGLCLINDIIYILAV